MKKKYSRHSDPVGSSCIAMPYCRFSLLSFFSRKLDRGFRTPSFGNVILKNCMFNNTQLEADMNCLTKCEKILVLSCKQL